MGDAPFDGSSFKVTLDILCLSLSVVEDLSTMKDRPCYSRLTSINSSSQRSTQTGSSDCEDEYVEEEEEADSSSRGVDLQCPSDALDVGSFGSGERNKSSSSENLSHPGVASLRVSESDKNVHYHGHEYDEYNQEEGRFEFSFI